MSLLRSSWQEISFYTGANAPAYKDNDPNGSPLARNSNSVHCLQNKQYDPNGSINDNHFYPAVYTFLHRTHINLMCNRAYFSISTNTERFISEGSTIHISRHSSIRGVTFFRKFFKDPFQL